MHPEHSNSGAIVLRASGTPANYLLDANSIGIAAGPGSAEVDERESKDDVPRGI